MKHIHISFVIVSLIFFSFTSCDASRNTRRNNTKLRKEPPCDCPKIDNQRFKRSQIEPNSTFYYSNIMHDTKSI